MSVEYRNKIIGKLQAAKDLIDEAYQLELKSGSKHSHALEKINSAYNEVRRAETIVFDCSYIEDNEHCQECECNVPTGHTYCQACNQPEQDPRDRDMDNIFGVGGW